MDRKMQHHAQQATLPVAERLRSSATHLAVVRHLSGALVVSEPCLAFFLFSGDEKSQCFPRTRSSPPFGQFSCNCSGRRFQAFDRNHRQEISTVTGAFEFTNLLFSLFLGNSITLLDQAQ
jgi:hypothetical protein